AAGASPHGEQLLRTGETFADEIFGAGNEVGEGIFFLQQLAVLIPLLAKLLAAPDVSDSIDEPPIDQTQAGRRKPSVDAKAVGAVAVKQQWILTVFLYSFAIDNRERDLGSVRGRRVKALG